ncbi:MAG: methyltransferase domain-containing protein [Planctomycetes bacterium]|nr:methyltransferase domain-containing protein [Planctomycetota bacterium]
MERVLEPEVMDTESEAKAYDSMDHSDVNRAFIRRFLELGGSGHVLDLGCGPAHIPIELCRREPHARVTAVDAAESMLAVGKRRVIAAGLAERIHLVRADAKRLPFDDHSFDSIMSNSIVHHLPDPRPCLREIARVARAEGAILLRDLVRPASEAELDHLVDLYAGDATVEQQGLYADSLRAAFRVSEVKAMLAECGLDELRVYASSDRHWTADREGAILRVDGLVEHPIALTFSALSEQTKSTPGEGGVALEALLALARPQSAGTHLTIHGADAFCASVPLADVAARAGILFREGRLPLARERGGPVRFVIPDATTCGKGGIDRCATVKAVVRLEVTEGARPDSRRG